MKARLDPVFMIGYGRSGTTLLSNMINANPGLSIAPEGPRSWEALIRKIGFGKQGRDRVDFIINSIINFDRRFPDPEDRDRLREIYSDNLPAYTDVVLACFFQAWAEKSGKTNPRWGDKYTSNWQFTHYLNEWYPDAQYIHLVRDPRDVVASILANYTKPIKIPRFLAPPHINLAWRWREAHRSCRKFGRDIGSKRYLLVKYEDIVGETEKTLRKMCGFLGADFTASMLSPDEKVRTEGLKGHLKTTHSELANPPNVKRIGTYRERLTREQAADIEALCRNELREMGYVLGDGGDYSMSFIKTILFSELFKVGWFMRKVYRRLRGRLV